MNRGRGRNARGRGRGFGPIPEAPVVPVPPVRFTILCKEFSQLGGTKFIGSEGIIEAQQWLKSIERIFTGLEITEAQKCQLAIWQLDESARDWWEMVTAHTIDENITWELFR